MPKVEVIQDDIYCECWGNIKAKVRTNICVPKDKLQTERQWAKQGYVVDRPTSEHKRGAYLWTNAYCFNKEKYYFDKEVRKGSKDELKAFFAPEREKRKELAKKCREQAKKEMSELQSELQCLISTTSNVISMSCKEIINNVEPNNSKTASVIVVDTETTGLDCSVDELLQVSIISDTKEVLYNSYLKPLRTEEWKEAERVNGISPDMVKDSPTVLTECVEINNIVSQADVIIGYNTQFDLDFLSSVGIENEKAEVVDVMLDFAEVYGEWSENYGCYKWQKLTTCAEYYNYDWGEDNAHNSLSDCRATLFCYQQLQNENIDLR